MCPARRTTDPLGDAGHASQPVVSLTDPTDHAVRQGPTGTEICVVLGMGEANRNCVSHFNLHHFHSLRALVVAHQISRRDPSAGLVGCRGLLHCAA